MDGRELVNFSSNDYLDFLNRKELADAAIEATRTYGTGSGSSRLVTGHLALHEQLESMLARQKGYPAAVFFGSGFLTNLGAITACAGREDTIVADRLVHASIIDAIRLSGARLTRFKHNDVEDLEARLTGISGNGRTLIITESVFSMDGDIAPLSAIAELAKKHQAMLMIDEAHATGVFGPSGHGLVSAHGLQSSVNLSMFTFSKALGGYGGAVACSQDMRDWLVNSARSLIYTTALPPSVCAAAIASMELLDREPNLGLELLHRSELFRKLLSEQGFATGQSASQIIPVMLGDNQRAVDVSRRMRERDFIVTAIRPPTVPEGTSRLRFSITLAHTEEDLQRAALALRDCVNAAGAGR